MDVIGILGLAFAVAAIATGYHIAARQGIFGMEKIILTVSQPTPFAKDEPLPRFSKEIRLRGISRSGSVYPFLFEMPLLVTFAIPASKNDHMVFLLVTLINRKRTTVQDVSVHINLPARLMPDAAVQFRSPEGMIVRRHIDEATGEGTVEYEISRLKPYDSNLIAEPLILRAKDVIETRSGRTPPA